MGLVTDKGVSRMETLIIRVRRIKTKTESDLTHFVHSGEVLKCYSFNLLYYLVLQSTGMETNSKMYPSWANKVNIDASGSNSKVSDMFKKTWEKMARLASNYIQDLKTQNIDFDAAIKYDLENIGASKGVHCGKKFGVQKLDDSNLTPQDLISRCGWLVKTLHSFFDYWTCTKASMEKSGRAINDWPHLCGGFPPTMESINTSKSKVKPFVDCLMGRHIGLPLNVRYYLVANGIRFFDEFLNVLHDEPLGKYKTLEDKKTKNMFVNKVRDFLTNCFC